MRIARAGDVPLVMSGDRAVDVRPLLPPVGDPTIALIDQWERVSRQLRSSPPESAFHDVSLSCPLPRPGKIVGVPANYRSHLKEMNVTTTVAELGVFLKAPSSVIGPGEVIYLPYSDRRTDQEGELAVVIGRHARQVDRDGALDYVFGYTCLLDITVRGGEDRSARKSFDTFTPIGPTLVTADEIPDPDDLRLRCWVGNELRQDCSTGEMIVDVRGLIAYASSVMTLEPGDIIATGTPAGVGPLTHGDTVAVEIERVGRLEVTVSAYGAVPWQGSLVTPRLPADQT
jgi:2-keto-4-pentenoate hydratase/2-oxohepta-3-ene-1,7-dioic acid hydratase in catechol pathway